MTVIPSNQFSLRCALLTVLLGMAGCGESRPRGAVSVEALAAEVRDSYAAQSSERLLSLFYFDGTPSELQQPIRNWLGAMWSKEPLKITKCDILRYDEYEKRASLPGEFDGRKLKFIVPPSHWIDFHAEREGEEKVMKLSKVYVVLPVAHIGGRWYVVGGTYND